MKGLQTYTKSELAGFYGVDKKTLMKMIHNHKILLEKLKETGYTKYQKLLFPIQIKLINEFLSSRFSVSRDFED